MTYGGSGIVPVPLLTIGKENQKTGDGTLIGTIFNVTLNGTVTPLPDNPGGLQNVDALQDDIRRIFADDGQLFEVKCDGVTIISAYPRINSLNFDQSTNNWVFTTPYIVELEYDDEPTSSGENSGVMPPYISTASEQWTIEFVDDKAPYTLELSTGRDANPFQLRISHNVSANGKRHFGPSGLDRPAWQEAREYVLPLLGFDLTKVSSSGVLNLTSANFTEYNHVRTEEINELDGSYNVSESWMVINPTGSGVAGRAIEDWTASVRTGTDTGLTSVSIEGTIQGLETRDYGSDPGDFSITEDKYAAASGYWLVVQDRLLPRVQLIGNDAATRAFNINPLTTVVGHNPTTGTITFSYEFDDRPSNCIQIDGEEVLSESIVISDNNPTDVFAVIPILGRANGPILQDINTVTEAKRSLSVEIVLQPSEICPTSVALVNSLLATSPKAQVDVITSALEGQLESGNSSVFRSADDESWDIKQGRYTRNVEWTYNNCT